MADALVSSQIALSAGVVSASLLLIASRKVSKISRTDLLPLMGVMGAFIFAAQMINFSIPGTGSSGHIIGGVLLGALLGPWAAFITLASVIIIQCLVFADGGLLALGCNLLNMAAMTCLVAYPFIYKPIVGKCLAKWRIMLGSVIACVVGLELGALLVSVETVMSGITELPYLTFLSFMLPIHLVIGVCEGIATGIVLWFVVSSRPGMLVSYYENFGDTTDSNKKGKRVVLVVLGILALVLAGTFSWIASSDPDGLEWSIFKVTGNTELGEAEIPSTAVMPEYDSTFAGLIGGFIVIVVIWGLCSILFHGRRKKLNT